MPLPLDTAVSEKMRRWSGSLNITLLIVAFLVLAGWHFDLYSLQTFFLPPGRMNPLSSLCFIMLGAAVLLLKNPATKKPGHVLVLIVTFAGLWRILSFSTGLEFSPDTILYTSKLNDPALVRPNQMSPVTAICFLVSGIVLLIRQTGNNRRIKITHYFLLIIAFISLLSLLGYLYQVKTFYGFLSYISMAASTAFCFFIFSQLILFSNPGNGIMKEFTSTLSGSLVARLLVPVAIIIPAVLGLLRLQGSWSGLYSNEFGTAIYVLSIIIIFVCIIWYNAYLLNKRDLLKKQTEDALRDSEQHIQGIFRNAPDAVVVINSEGRVTKWNPEAEVLFGWKENEVTGHLLSDLIIPEDFKELHKRGLERYLNTGESSILGRTVDLWGIRKDGSGIDISLRISPLELGDKKYFIGFLRDITERKKMENRLKWFNEELSLQVEEKTSELRDIFERITDGFIALDRNFRYTYVNKKAGELIQREPASLLGKNVWDEFPDVVGSDTYHAFHKAMDEQKFTINTDYYPPLDFWQSNFIYPSPNGLSIFIRDITNQKRAESEIQKAKDIADKLIDSLPGVFYFFDGNGKFIRWNREFENVTGYSADEITKMQPIDFFVENHKEFITERIAGVFSEGHNDAEASFLTRDGREIPYFFKATRIVYEGKPCLLGTGIDIAERKKSEEELIESERKYKLLFESNPLPMWMLALPEYYVTDVNNAALALYGYSKEEFLKLSAFDFRPPEDIPKFKAVTNTAFRGIHHAGIWRHIKKDRTLIYVDIVTYDLKYHGSLTRLVLGNNVTEKYIAEEKLKESYESIRKLTSHLQNVREEERLHMSREIHDELGQLITVLKMDVSWLNKKVDPADETLKNKLQEILSVIDTTSKTIRRIASELRPSLLDDLGLFAAMEWHIEEFERRSGIKKELNLPDAEIQLPNALKIGLFRIFQESLTNVARHADAEMVFVSLAQEEKHLVLTIRDNGKGFEERQGPKKTLGLLGMKERSQMMGGQYKITSNPGKGTIVTVTVPLPGTDL